MVRVGYLILSDLSKWSPGGKKEGAANTEHSFKEPDLEQWGKGEDTQGGRRLGDGAAEMPRAEEPGTRSR